MADSSAKPTKKRAPIPKTHSIHKRPALRPSISSPYTGRSHPKVIYVQARTPFISAIKRAQKLLELIRKRDEPIRGGITDQEILARGRVKGSKAVSSSSKPTPSASRLSTTEDNDPHRKPEEIYFKGTGKAVERVLELGLWFQQRHQYQVRVTTGEVGVIDDIVEKPAESADHGDDAELQGADDTEMQDGNVDAEKSTGAEHRQVPETRIRNVSMIQVAVSWR